MRFLSLFALLIVFLFSCAGAPSPGNSSSNSPSDFPQGAPQNFEGTEGQSAKNSVVSLHQPRTFKRLVNWEDTPQSTLFQSGNSIVSQEQIRKAASNLETKQVGNLTSDKSMSYTLQFEMVADFDQAQKRRWSVAKNTGLATYLQFDSPFYKIRAGRWKSKTEVEDAQLQYKALGISSFIVELD